MRAGFKALIGAVVIVAVGGAGFLWLTAPERVTQAALDGLTGDAARGERIFNIGGCASCHAAPDAENEARLVLAGGQAFTTDFGTFHAPNISPGPAGIGGWSALDLVNAMQKGVSPDGAHYYPAFPYASYARMELADIVDLKAHLDTLPVSAEADLPHDVAFPFNIRRGIGLWNLINLDPAPVVQAKDPLVLKGRYLVEGPGHCAECHTPRDMLGGLDLSRWMAGAPNPDGKGRTPNLTPGDGGLDWSEADIAEYLRSGFTPEYDVVGGAMAAVVRNTARLDAEDRTAIAAYLKALPPLPKER